VRIVLVNNPGVVRDLIGDGADAQFLPALTGSARDGLFRAITANSDATLIIDSELKTSAQSRYQELEGLKLAYECRTNPQAQFRGFITLVGFLPLAHVKQHRYGGLLRGGERVHSRTLSLPGARYCRYPELDTAEQPPLRSDEWSGVVEELDEIFVQAFRAFEHVFRNIVIMRNLDMAKRREKTDELKSHLRTLEQIERTTVIQKRYHSQFDLIVRNLRMLIGGLGEGDDAAGSETLAEVKLSARTLSEDLMGRGAGA
jgi:hypothetical protein